MQLWTSLCCYGNWFQEAPSPDRELTVANCIAPDSCEKIVASVPIAGCGLHFLHSWKIFTVASPVSMQNITCVPAATKKRDAAANRLLRTVRLSANHWWYQLLSQSWVVEVWCLWIRARRLMTYTTVMNCCSKDFCHQRSVAHLGDMLLFSRTGHLHIVLVTP